MKSEPVIDFHGSTRSLLLMGVFHRITLVPRIPHGLFADGVFYSWAEQEVLVGEDAFS